MSKAITQKHDERTPERWDHGPETAPSFLREDEPTLARTLGMIGAFLIVFGGAIFFFTALGRNPIIGTGWATFFIVLGVVGLLSHASFDRDLQVRRLYWGGGLALLALGAVLCMIPAFGGQPRFFALGYPALGLSLLFLLAVLHHEQDPTIRTATIRIIGAAGAAGAVTAFLFGNNFGGREFMVPYGALLALLALVYLTAFVNQVGIASDLGFKAAAGIGALGALAVLIGLLRSIFASSPYLVPWGLLFIGLGLLYAAVSVGLWSDAQLVVVARRELASYFFSPLIYLILPGVTLVAWYFYQQFVVLLSEYLVREPIIQLYIWPVIQVLLLTIMVPFVTMRLLSEEKRSGSLEILLTAPVKESTVVVGKFIAAFVLYLLLWLPWWLFLVALRVGGGEPFDYRSVFSFVIAVAVTGAGFVAMGLFFSSLTKNQLASAVLTFAAMMLFLGLFLLQGMVDETNPWGTVLRHTDYVTMWREAIDGKLVLKYLLFPLSMMVLWLFATVKVLEARRWA